MTSGSVSLLIFWLDENRYAVPLEQVEQVHPAVEVTTTTTSSSASPGDFLGFVSVHGTVVPVIDIRVHFGLPPCQIEVHHMMIVARDGEQMLAFFVDRVEDVISYNREQVVIADTMLYANSKVKILSLDNGLVELSDLRDYLGLKARQWQERRS